MTAPSTPLPGAPPAIPAPPSPQSPPDLRELDRSLLRGIAWTSGAKWAGQILAWASTLIVARLLTPEDYGLVGMASVYLGLITLASEFGLGSAVVTLRNLSDARVAQLNGLSILFGVASFALSCAAAQPLGRFFHASQLPAVVIAMSGAFVITGFKTVPFALLQRDLRFRVLAVVETGRAVILAAAMIGFALLGLRYWTLVIGGLLSSLLSTAATQAVRRHRIAWPRRGHTDDAIKFSAHVLIGRLSWYTYTNADFLVAGRVLGSGALGLYEIGWNLANIPLDRITSLVAQVTPPIFAAVQHDLSALRRYLLSITEALAFVTLPASVGMALVARDFVLFALGDKWSGAIVPLQLLALSVAFRSVTPLLPQVLYAIGEYRLAVRYGVLCAVVLPPAFLVGAKWLGTAGLAVAWLLVFPAVTVPAYRRVLERIELRSRDYLLAFWPAASASVVMAVVLVLVQISLAGRVARGPSFAIQVSVGAVAYAAGCLAFHARRVRVFAAVLRNLRTPSVPAAETV